MEPFVGEIRLFAGNYLPKGWLACEGQTLNIQQNMALYAVIGYQFGGDGKTTFQLPNMIGRAAMGSGNGTGLTPRLTGQSGGATAVPLTAAQIPPHTHLLIATSGTMESDNADGSWWCKSNAGVPFYSPAPDGNTQLATDAIAASGGGQPHDNMQPVTVMRFAIAIQGIFPPRP